MAAQTWPTSLPDFDKPLLSQYEEQPGSTAIRTKMEVGPDKMRRRTTATVGDLSVAYIMTRSQVATLDNFYDATLAQGSLRFDAVHPRTGNTVEVRFRERPQYRARGPNTWVASFPAEVPP